MELPELDLQTIEDEFINNYELFERYKGRLISNFQAAGSLGSQLLKTEITDAYVSARDKVTRDIEQYKHLLLISPNRQIRQRVEKFLNDINDK